MASLKLPIPVATALTVYGIETSELQLTRIVIWRLQQHLPFTVLKRSKLLNLAIVKNAVATALTVYGIETS